MSGNYYCCVCGKPATVCRKETKNGVTTVSYYCDDCAKLLDQGPSFSDLIASMFNFGGDNHIYKSKMRVCKCGTTERDVINSGKFGCAECYNVFRDIADNYLHQRGYLEHKGKAPIKFGNSSLSKIDSLKEQLAKAIAEQRFLDADSLSRQIAELQKKEG